VPALYSLPLSRGMITKEHTAIPSRACHTRWLRKVDFEIGRQLEDIPPILYRRPGGVAAKLIGCHRIARKGVPRIKQGFLHARWLWSRTAVFPSFLSRHFRHSECTNDDANANLCLFLVSRVALAIKRDCCNAGTGYRRYIDETFCF
jgi:hypothetical protein